MKSFIPVCAVLLLVAGAAFFPKPAAAASATAPKPMPGSDDLLDAVAWTQSSIEHDLVFREIYRDAQAKLLEALHDKQWDAAIRRAQQRLCEAQACGDSGYR